MFVDEDSEDREKVEEEGRHYHQHYIEDWSSSQVDINIYLKIRLVGKPKFLTS